MSELKIYRASAGSGKTYTLSGEFIKLLFSDPQSYKSILAVTFTNKATAEMKNRILENLFALATAPKPDYLTDLMKIHDKPEAYIRKVAKSLLINILNDFSKFSINTIDSFFQKVIRSFAYEANLPANFKVELDSERILAQAVDNLLRELELKGNEDLKEWLIKHTLSKIEEGKDWNIAQELNTLGREVFKEEFQSLKPEVLQKLRDKKLLNSYRYTLKKITDTFEESIQEAAQKGLDALKTYAVSWDILQGKSRSPLKKLEKLVNVTKAADYLEIIKLDGLVNNPETCFHSKNSESDNSIVIDCFNGGLNEALQQLSGTFIEQKTNYYSAKAILSNLNALGITTDIALKVNELARNENLFLLADANRLLQQIIDENDTPFIYEKTGTRFQHYMIDEFQDTSRLQWNNFKPLLQNSVSDGHMAMIVGDVKQSIYRWRNSDWKLLSDQVNIDFASHGIEAMTLDTNWRSTENVITFNNIVFAGASRMLQTEFINSSAEAVDEANIPGDLHAKISMAYDDTIQQVSPKSVGSGGFIHVDFVDGKNAEFRNNATQNAIVQIERLLDEGYDYKDICILVRRKSEGQEITEALLSGAFSPSERKHPVISNETLLLSSSPAVNLVIQQIKYIQEPDNAVFEAFIKLYSHFYQSNVAEEVIHCDTEILNNDNRGWFKELSNQLLSLKGQPLFEMAEALVRQLPDELHQNQFVFLQGLLDAVRDYVTNYSVNAHDFINWWDDKGQGTAISVPEGQNAINVMTIHKSKGLEFKAVIIPYCNWNIDDKGRGSLIWSRPKEAPFNELELVPVNYSDTLLHSIFIEDYLTERLHQFVDNLNLLYVALTRAEESLVIMAEKPAKTGGLKNVSHLLFRLINQFNMLAGLDEQLIKNLVNGWDDTEQQFEFGSIPAQKPKEQREAPSIDDFRTTELGSRIKIHPESIAMSSPDSLKHLKHGKLMHRLFELIETTEDVDRAITKLVLNGQLKTSEKDSLRDFVKQKINQEKVKDWFQPQSKIINEGTIMVPSGTYRPDRVIISDTKVVVVDYKFGELKQEKYALQVKRYMDLLKKMGYENVQGYIWYLHEQDEIIDITDQAVQGSLF
ncbi:UvrD-helicase domain-containing protein [Carboxylicivirga sp. A043]|uniref:UvrD-helicase domain-containing protein n=1 Tax=Carboxylicivirga litoralis TaxID=2816963 RepID=UPI0021CB18F3|nr:UvrD-helicase domain-containing protein [Carboxylicivirga sp. A043]MCU4157932.1 UvrD-helicase domain-containing protein [Carboxylicivirga sp. A043]